jgi:hypothetical protein
MSTPDKPHCKSNHARMMHLKKLEEALSKLRKFKELMVFCKRIQTLGYYDIWTTTLKKMFKISKDLEEFSILYHISPTWSEIRKLAKEKADSLLNESLKNA